MSMTLRSQLWSATACLLRRWMSNASAQQMLCLSLAEQKSYFSYLLEQNRQPLPASYPYKPSASPVKKSLFRFVQAYFQLPCSETTRLKRSQWLAERGFKDKRILLMGDDDMVSVTLAEQGFAHVTAADCDESVLAQIQHLSQDLATPPKAVRADFSQTHYTPPCEADLVCLDPPYNLPWVMIFLKAALRSFPHQRPGTIVMMLNPTCLAQHEWQQVEQTMSKEGFRLVAHHRHFNAYPLTGLSQWTMRAAFVVFAGFKAPLAQRRLYFGSDLFAFQRE